MVMTKYETFKYKGREWKQYAVPKADEAYVMGVDLGQSQDPTALTVIHYTLTPTQDWEVNERLRTTKPKVTETFRGSR